MKKNRQALNEVADINGSKVFVEKGEVKTIHSEAIQQSGYMTIEEARQLTIAEITKIYQLNVDLIYVEDACHAQNMYESQTRFNKIGLICKWEDKSCGNYSNMQTGGYLSVMPCNI